MDYSKDANNKKRKNRRSKKKKRKNRALTIVLRVLLIMVLVGISAVIGAVAGAYKGIIDEASPAIDTIVRSVVPDAYTTYILDINGNDLDSLHGIENRDYVKLQYIPQDLQNAVVAIEDERFYTHNGIDVKGMMRAVVANVKTMSFSEGASTITQQLIKNNVASITSEKKMKRKLQEQYLAVKLEEALEASEVLGSKKETKDYILELYLNTINLNNGVYGVQVAARYYFGKEVSELTLAECASIAGITKNPSRYSPNNPEANKERQETVLWKMLDLGYITQSQYDQAMAEDIYTTVQQVALQNEQEDTIHSYFVDALINQVAKDLRDQKDIDENLAVQMIYSGGLTIKSTLNPTFQAIIDEEMERPSNFYQSGLQYEITYFLTTMDPATEDQQHFEKTALIGMSEEAVQQFVQECQAEFIQAPYEFFMDNMWLIPQPQASFVLMDYHTGYVLGLSGGRGEKYGARTFNRATQAERQPGSCFKILAAYAPALDMGIIHSGTILVDEPYTANGRNISNWWGGTYRGASSVRQGIYDSMNVLAVKVIDMVGYDAAFNYLLNFGFSTLVGEVDENGRTDKIPVLALGGITNGVTNLELTAAYGAIANDGQYLRPTLYTQVLDREGNVLLEYSPQPRTVIKSSTAYLLTDMMRDVLTKGTGTEARFRNISMPIAGKTGTTTDNYDQTFVGYTPYYVAGVWTGYDVPKSLPRGNYHLFLWRSIMERVHQDLPTKSFQAADTSTSGLISRSICKVTGKIAVPGVCDIDGGGGIMTEYFVPGTEPTEICEGHTIIEICLESGKLATEFCPAEVRSRRALASLSEEDLSSVPTEYCDMHTDLHNPEDDDLLDPDTNTDDPGFTDPIIDPPNSGGNSSGTEEPSTSPGQPFGPDGPSTDDPTPPDSDLVAPITNDPIDNTDDPVVLDDFIYSP